MTNVERATKLFVDAINKREHDDERVAVNAALIAAYDALNTVSDTEYNVNGHIDNVLHRVMDALDIIGIQPAERCAYCDEPATDICDTCGASLCHDHVMTTGHTAVVNGIEIPYTYCRKFACINGKPVGVVPYITCA